MKHFLRNEGWLSALPSNFYYIKSIPPLLLQELSDFVKSIVICSSVCAIVHSAVYSNYVPFLFNRGSSYIIGIVVVSRGIWGFLARI